MTEDTADHDDMTRATARLPGLAIEITHRQAQDAEHISIHLQATPSFESFGRFIESTNPFTFWAQAMQMAWAPWLQVARAMTTAAETNETQRKLPGR